MRVVWLAKFEWSNEFGLSVAVPAVQFEDTMLSAREEEK